MVRLGSFSTRVPPRRADVRALVWGALALMATVLTPFSPEAQAQKYGSAGCGPGAVIMGPRGGQVSAATSNWTSWPTMGGALSSKSSQCKAPGTADLASREQIDFMQNNLVQLEKEVAQGDGETLLALSDLLGCQSATYPLLRDTLKNAHGEIFRQPGAMAVLESIKESVHEQDTLATACTQALPVMALNGAPSADAEAPSPEATRDATPTTKGAH